MKRFLVFPLMISLLVVSSLQPSSAAADGESVQVLKAAKTQVKAYLDLIPEGRESEYGFHDRKELKRVRLEKPYRMYSVEEDGELRFLDYWRVPVCVGEDFRALLEVKQAGDRYEVFGIGAAVLATELDHLERKTQGKNRASTIQRKSILRSYSKKADFVVFDDDVSDRGRHRTIQAHALKAGKMFLQDKGLSKREMNGLQPEETADVQTLEDVLNLLTE
jgi:hypothetical protein